MSQARTSKKWFVSGALGALVAVTVFLSGRRQEVRGLEVIVIGLDGANTRVISPLLQQGRMPNLARFLKAGAGGQLDSPVDRFESAALWTTIVTGLRPECHGVTDFMLPAEDRYGPILDSTLVRDGYDGTRFATSPRLIFAQSGHRRAKALWNILNDRKRESVILGLWATWPAESIAGAIVSDNATYSRIRLSKQFQVEGQLIAVDNERHWGIVRPAEYVGPVGRLVRLPQGIERERLARFADFTPEELDKIQKGEFVGSMNTGTDPFQELKYQIQSDRSYVDIANYFRDGEPRIASDLTFLYLEGVDVMEHQFFGHHAGAKAVPEAERARFHDVLNRYHEFTDELIGGWLAKASPNTVVIIVSDHGFNLVDDEKHPTGWHDRNAIFFAAGGPIRAGATIRGTGTLFDVTPTVLHLLGIPVADDLEGRVLDELIDPAWLAAHPIERTKSYGKHVREYLPASGSDTDDDIVGRLKEFGYMGGPDGPVVVKELPRIDRSAAECARCHDDDR